MYREGANRKRNSSPHNQPLMLRSCNARPPSQSPTHKQSMSKQMLRQSLKSQQQQAPPKSKHTRHKTTEHAASKPSPTPHKDLTPSFISSGTPKHQHLPKRPIERDVKTTKASQVSGRQLFVNTHRYDLKQLFERPKQPSQRRDSADRSRSHKKSVLSNRAKYPDDTTIKIERNKEDNVNVKALLTPQEYNKFGERFPDNFRRIGLLGRGGFSVVWLGVHRLTRRKVAIKQTLTKNPHQTHLKEIWFASYFLERGGEVREQFQGSVGIENICRMYSHDITSVDSWLYYQLCGQSLGSSLFELKAEGQGSQRFYRMHYGELIDRMRLDPSQLQTIIIEVAKALFLINGHNIVHSDLKTQNILLSVNDGTKGNYVRGVKLIDFGSSFLFTNLKQFSMATPEYMPPQILNYILFQNKLDYDQSMLQLMDSYKNPWVVDVWSLGCIVLEILTGVPLWMSIPTEVPRSPAKVTGIFAVKNRVFAKIIQKQREVVKQLDHYLDNYNHSGVEATPHLRSALKQMLALDPEKRISPRGILSHFGLECHPLSLPSY